MTIKKAYRPEDITDLFLEYSNSGNIDGLVSLYEENAVLIKNAENAMANGHDEIKEFYAILLADNPKFEKGQQRPAIVNGNIALTSSRLINGFVTAEVARKQPDDSWRWFIDQPRIAIEKI
jgi:ketosteroid isomerase-like protein